MDKIQIGDKVTNTISGVVGVVTKQYFPTACTQQTMVKTKSGRMYHAPTNGWRLWRDSDGDNEHEEPLLAACATPMLTDVAAPIMQPHEYRNVQIDKTTSISIDLLEVSKQLERELYKDFNIYRGLQYLA